MSIYHAWSKISSYEIKVKTRDVFGDESEWETLSVSMPKNKLLRSTLFDNLLDRVIDNFSFLLKFYLVLFYL